MVRRSVILRLRCRNPQSSRHPFWRSTPYAARSACKIRCVVWKTVGAKVATAAAPPNRRCRTSGLSRQKTGAFFHIFAVGGCVCQTVRTNAAIARRPVSQSSASRSNLSERFTAPSGVTVRTAGNGCRLKAHGVRIAKTNGARFANMHTPKARRGYREPPDRIVKFPTNCYDVAPPCHTVFCTVPPPCISGLGISRCPHRFYRPNAADTAKAV